MHTLLNQIIVNSVPFKTLNYMNIPQIKKTIVLINLAFSLLILSCNNTPTINADEIINNAISVYGGDKVYDSEITFTFREKIYKAIYKKENYQLERIFTEDSLTYRDVLTNTTFNRYINNKEIILEDEWKNKYTNSINSVVYFFRIPFNLNDKAVSKTYLGEAIINQQYYHKIKVTFQQEGGGEDYSDVFIYWINKTKYTIDYLAYSYETDGGGKRFRKMINPRKVDDLLVVDYINYKPNNINERIENFDVYFEKNGFEELSRIEHENISIQYN